MHIGGTQVGPLTILLALLSSTGGFIFGYDTGQISDILLMPDFLMRFGTPDPSAASGYSFSTVREGLIVGMLSIGTLIGALAGSYLSNALGRRKAITGFAIIFSVGILIQVTAFYAWYQVMIGRIVTGLGVGALSAAVPVYQSETVPKQLRGTLIATYQLMITFGILLAYCFCIGTREMTNSGAWRVPIALGWVFGAFLGVGILFMPESPRWLVDHDQRDEALRSIARVRGTTVDHPTVQAEFSEIVEGWEMEQKHGSGSWLECFVGYEGGHKTVYRTIMGMMLQMFQQLTGANYFFYYGATIFQSVGLADSYVTQIILGAVNFACTFLGLYVMEKFGRRWPLIIGGVWCSAWLFAFASVGVTHDVNEKSTGTFLIVAACMFILGYAATWAPGIWILIGESFHMRNRSRQAALSTASNWLWNFLLAFFTPFIVGDIQLGYGYVFAGCNLAGAVFVYFVLYESAGLSLEAVDQMYSTPGLKAWQSGKWAPPQYANRAEAMRDAKSSTKETSMIEHANGSDPRASFASQNTAVDPSATTRMGEKKIPVPRV